MILFYCLLLLLILQRCIELFFSVRNEKILKALGAVEHRSFGLFLIVLLFTAFYAGLVSEKIFFDRAVNPLWPFFLAVFACSQILRYWAMAKLGRRWNVKILVLPGAKLVSSGPYRFLRHPMYVGILVDFAVVPLLFSCYLTAAVTCVAGFFLLKKRIREEESALKLPSRQ